MFYPQTMIDEVQQLQKQYAEYFIDTTDNTFLNIRSKHENIFNHDEINKNSRKKLIISQLLARKIVMHQGEYNGRNLYHEEYQALYTTPQLTIIKFEQQRSLFMIQ